MRCPFCGHLRSRVLDSRLGDQQDSVRRRRQCGSCERRFTTHERYDQGPLYIRKRSGGRQPFDRAKLLAGLERAAIKRPVERDQLETIVDGIVARLRAEGGTPDADRVGELALSALRELDPVAYVRFASVYRKFDDLAEFEAELERLEQKLPGQREHLFEATPADAGPTSSVRPEGQAAELPPEPGKGSAKSGTGASGEGNQESLEER